MEGEEKSLAVIIPCAQESGELNCSGKLSPRVGASWPLGRSSVLTLAKGPGR